MDFKATSPAIQTLKILGIKCNSTRITILWSLKSALSTVCLETVFVNSHICQAHCQLFCQWITWKNAPISFARSIYLSVHV
jgi:hypothetical protein